MDLGNFESNLLTEFTSITGCEDIEAAKFFLAASNWDIGQAVEDYFEEQSARDEHGIVEQPHPAPAALPVLPPVASTPAKKTASKNSSGKRGVAIQDNTDDSLVNKIINKAKMGGQAHQEEPEKKPKKSYFGGAGHSLSSEPTPVTTRNVQPQQETELPPANVMVTFWRNGFTIDDGELRDYNRPENQAFLQAINSGRAPTEFFNVQPNQPVNLNIAKKIDEDYVASHKPQAAFQGQGHRLGSVVPGESKPKPKPTNTPANATIVFSVDESRPRTQIQIRMADGTRMVAAFNTDHRVSDIRNFINLSKLGERNKNYKLSTNFPKKDIVDEDQTLQEAALLNSVVVQTYL